MTRNKKILIGVGVAVALGGIAYANVRFKRVVGVTVNTEAIKKRNLEAIVSASGKIQPKRFVNISADTMGRVTDLAVNEGDRVKKDQFLLQVDPRNLRSAVTRTQASLEAARSQTQQLLASIDSAKTSLKQAEDNLNRQQQLWKGGLTTREAFDRAENELKMRQSDLRSQEQQIQTQRLRMQQEEASLETDRYNLSKVRIESPINGIVTRRNIEEGEMVVIGTMNNAGTVLLTIADMSVIEAEVDVDETDIPGVKLGQITKITIDAFPDKTFTGKVTEIGNSPIQATGGAARAGDELQGGGHARHRDSGGPPRLHLHGGDHDGHARTTCSRFRSRRPRCARWSSTTRARSSGRRTRAASAPRPSGTVQASELQARSDAQGARRCIPGPRRQGCLRADQDRHRRRQVLRVAQRRQGRRQRDRRPVQLGPLRWLTARS